MRRPARSGKLRMKLKELNGFQKLQRLHGLHGLQGLNLRPKIVAAGERFGGQRMRLLTSSPTLEMI